MNLKNINFEKKIKRKNFFLSLAAGAAGFYALRSFPFRLFGGKKVSQKNENTKYSRVKIDPLAVSRKNTGGNNV